MSRGVLAGYRALVTGASSGIGAQAALALSQAGADLVVVARRAERLSALVEQMGGGHAVVADLSLTPGAMAAVDEAHARLGGLDVVVNAAGTNKVARALVEDIDDVRRIFDVNVLGAFAVCQRAATLMKSTGGSIINVASVIAGVSETTTPQAGYAASKGAMVSMTREMAVQWGRYRIRVNTLAPGWFPTEMTAEVVSDAARVADFERRIPLGRFGSMDDITGPVVFLASAASAYMTGQVLIIDGGISCV